MVNLIVRWVMRFGNEIVVRVTSMRVLVIEDDPKVARLLERGLTEHGYAVELADKALDGQHMAAYGTYDVIVLDCLLPDAHGFDVSRTLRSKGIETPILMLTALGDTPEKIRGLDAGADDYLAKPFEFDELVARIRALMRRGDATESTTLKYGNLSLDLLARKASRADTQVTLTGREFALLEYFLRNPDRVLTRTSIAEHVWGVDLDPESNVIDVYVSTLRRKIDKSFDEPLIHTVVGTGYVFSDQPPGA